MQFLNKQNVYFLNNNKKRIPALGHLAKWLQAQPSVCPLPSPAPKPAAAPALYSGRVSDRPRSMLVLVLNKHIGPIRRGRASCRLLADWQRGGKLCQTSISWQYILSPIGTVAREPGKRWDVAVRRVWGHELFCIFLFNLCFL